MWPTAPTTHLLSMSSHNTGTVRHCEQYTVCVSELPAQTRKEKNVCLFQKCVNMFVCVYHSEELGEYMESKGASTRGIMTLTTNLSKPFTRLERYPTLLKELDRHMEVSLSQPQSVLLFR